MTGPHGLVQPRLRGGLLRLRCAGGSHADGSSRRWYVDHERVRRPGVRAPGTCRVDAALATPPAPAPATSCRPAGRERRDLPGHPVEIWDDPSGAYSGVPLVRDVPTVARVYASVTAGVPTDVADVPAELHGYAAAGAELAGSPSPRRRARCMPGRRCPRPGPRRQAPTSSRCRRPGRRRARSSSPPMSTPRSVARARSTSARAATPTTRFSLGPVAFATVAPLTIRPFAITYSYKPLDPHTDFVPQTPPDLSRQFDRARDLLPIPTGGLTSRSSRRRRSTSRPRSRTSCTSGAPATTSRWPSPT